MQIKRHLLQFFLLLNVLFCKNPNSKPSYFAIFTTASKVKGQFPLALPGFIHAVVYVSSTCRLRLVYVSSTCRLRVVYVFRSEIVRESSEN